MIILGIDPGTAITGFGALKYAGSYCRALGYGCIKTEAGESAAERLRQIHAGVCELIDAYSPEAVSIEQLFFNKNVGSALAVGQARGVAMLAAAQHDIPIYEYTPTAVKLGVTGEGRAPKSQVAFMVKALLGLDEIPRPDDVSDALAVAICHAHTGLTTARWQKAGESV